MNPDEDHLTQLAFGLMATALTPKRFSVLLQSCGCNIPQHVVHKTGLTRTTVCQSAFELNKDGMVDMVRSTEDRRSVLIKATPEGEKLIKKVIQTLNAITWRPQEPSESFLRVDIAETHSKRS